MPNIESPVPARGRASLVLLADWRAGTLALLAYRAPHMISIYFTPPELAAMLAAAVLGGGAFNG
jgi:hypothetical protein